MFRLPPNEFSTIGSYVMVYFSNTCTLSVLATISKLTFCTIDGLVLRYGLF